MKQSWTSFFKSGQTHGKTLAGLPEMFSTVFSSCVHFERLLVKLHALELNSESKLALL